MMKFFRRNGHIIPIREKNKDRAVAAGGVAGAAVAADAARTRTVYKTKALTIERKAFSFLPMDSYQSKRPRFGTALFAKNAQGKRVGRMHFAVDKTEGVIDWLSVKKAERGKGISKKLAKAGAVEMKAAGANHIFTHVVHPRSAALLEGEKGIRSQYWRVTRTTQKSGMFLEGIPKSEALAKAGMWKGKPGKFSFTEGMKATGEFLRDKLKFGGKAKYDYAGPTIYRQVNFPKTGMRRQIKPFMSTKNKILLGAGAAVAAASAAYLLNKHYRGAKNGRK